MGRTNPSGGQCSDDESHVGSAEADPKKKTIYAHEQNAEHRQAWRIEVETLDADRFVFIDETSTTTTMTRRYARAHGQARAYGDVPRNQGTRTTLIAAMTSAGMGAAMTLPGAADTAAFRVYVEQVLCPTLRPGQIVWMDNLSVHKAPVIQALITGVQCELRWLPPYSPDFSPIEQAFSKIKTDLRNAAARTQETLDAAISRALEQVTAQDAQGWFKHCGYILTRAT